MERTGEFITGPAATAGAFYGYKVLMEGKDPADKRLLGTTAALAGTALAGTILFDEVLGEYIMTGHEKGLADTPERFLRRFPEVALAIPAAAAASSYFYSGRVNGKTLREGMLRDGLLVGGAAMASQLLKETIWNDA